MATTATYDLITENNGYRCIIGQAMALNIDAYEIDHAAKQIKLMNADGSVVGVGNYSTLTIDGKAVA